MCSGSRLCACKSAQLPQHVVIKVCANPMRLAATWAAVDTAIGGCGAYGWPLCDCERSVSLRIAASQRADLKSIGDECVLGLNKFS